MLEKEILKFWQENKIFEKSLDKKSPNGDFVFYDGPPFATGTPHYGHILASIIKDAIPRYKTMKGYKVKRRWGWDCHGLPVEYEIEKELGFKTKKEIENYGVEKFNKAAKDSVLRYADEWKKTIARIGRWVDMENDYKTMDWEYTESVWWVFRTLFNKELIYEGYKSMHLCPRCETTLSSLEVGMNYKDITDISVTVKFELENELNTYILAWTTTPWTLLGNAALAINPEIEYVKIRIQTTNNEPQQFILAKKRLEILGEEKYEILDNLKGEELIGKKYKPFFDYYPNDKNLKNRENGWKIYGADFVTTNEGTGVVHIAPAFGEDDYNLAQKHDLPFIQHVSIDGRFKQEVKDFVGLSVKPKDEHQKTDIEIIKWLAANNKLFSKQKISHSYPYCWRCDTPLINYAASSWFVKVASIKNKLIEINKKINWIPEYIKEGRFGNWLKEARDWAISRSRFWGAPIPVSKCQKCEKIEIIGSLDDLKNKIEKSGNKYFVMRHGEAQSNIENIASCNIKNGHHLTEKGKKQVATTALELKGEKIDMIFSSDYLRTKETAEIMTEKLGINGDNLIFDERIREVNVGIFDGRSAGEYHKYFSSLKEKFYKNPPEGENLIELKNRVAEFLYEIDAKYFGKNILIISHEYSIWLIFATALGADAKKAVEIKKDKPDFVKTGEFQKLDFAPLPHNRNYEIDLHRPYIDEIELKCNCGGKMKRILEVFDCWFESGSMPYGQAHYPFSGGKLPFPAEFIAEGLDQTRGWFYTMLVLSAAIFNKPAYKNSVVNGIILAEDGQKMSKRLKNYPDPMEIIEKYGADALRLYLLSSPVMRAEDLRFSEKSVDEIYKKVILRLWNVYKFYELYADKKMSNVNPSAGGQISNVLDKWIIARLEELKGEISKWMDKYELDKASRPIGDFIDDLSTWYLRRSRERFKNENEDKKNAIATTRYVLLEFSKLIAPFMPFMSESIYQQLMVDDQRVIASVHLENWPKLKPLISRFAEKLLKRDKKLLETMVETRKICSLGLEARQKAGIKVRQPIAFLKIKNQKSKIKNNEELLDLIKDEINVKEIVFDSSIKNEVEIDTIITPELKKEGQLRELTRFIQDLRKINNLTPVQKIVLEITTSHEGKNLIEKFESEFKKSVGAEKIEFKDVIESGGEIKIDEMNFRIKIGK